MARPPKRKRTGKAPRQRKLDQLRRSICELAEEVERVLDEPFDDFIERHLHDRDRLLDDCFFAFNLGRLVVIARQLNVSLENTVKEIPTIRHTMRS